MSEPLSHGKQIDFLTIKRKPIDARVERRMVTAQITRALADGASSFRLFKIANSVQREYQRSLVTVEHSDSENGAWGSCSTRRQVQESAAVCKNASAAANRVLRRRPAGSPQRGDPLCVLVPECYSGLLPRIDYRLSNLFNKFGNMEVIAFSWHPLGRLHADMKKLQERRPHFLKTVYLLDLTTPLRMTVREFARLKINAGPWFGHWFAFVDLASNPVDDLPGYLKHESDEDRQAIIFT